MFPLTLRLYKIHRKNQEFSETGSLATKIHKGVEIIFK